MQDGCVKKVFCYGLGLVILARNYIGGSRIRALQTHCRCILVSNGERVDQKTTIFEFCGGSRATIAGIPKRAVACYGINVLCVYR